MRFACCLSLMMLAAWAGPAAAQLDLLPANGIQLGEASVQYWQVGMTITAGSPCLGVYGTATVPKEWPEQKVKIVVEQIQPRGKIAYRELDNGVRQMQVAIPYLQAGETATALVTFEVTRHAILPPDDTAQFVMPTRPPRSLRPFLGSSPYIETRNNLIRRQGKKLIKGDVPAWEKVETIYDWVREHVEYKDGKLKGALAALRDGDGDCEELTSLFIAMCRVNQIPARTVWVPGHCYPEFYLKDKQGQGHWFPCQAAGTRDFGGMPDQRPILQKGDNFEVPEEKEPQRYVAEHLKVKAVRGGNDPQVQFIRKSLPAPPPMPAG